MILVSKQREKQSGTRSLCQLATVFQPPCIHCTFLYLFNIILTNLSKPTPQFTPEVHVYECPRSALQWHCAVGGARLESCLVGYTGQQRVGNEWSVGQKREAVSSVGFGAELRSLSCDCLEARLDAGD